MPIGEFSGGGRSLTKNGCQLPVVSCFTGPVMAPPFRFERAVDRPIKVAKSLLAIGLRNPFVINILRGNAVSY